MSFASSSSSAGMALRSAVRASRRTVASAHFAQQPLRSRSHAQISRHYATEQLLRPGSSSVSEGALDGADRVEELERHADDATGSTTATTTTTTTTTTRTSPLSSSSSSSSSSSGSAYRGSSHLTGQKAQEYLTELLHLDPSRQFSPKLALQILTHKSYRFTYLPQTPHLHPAPTPAEVENAQTAAHNARLSFLGRRAIASYLTMFLHAAMASEGQTLRSVSLLRPTESLSEKLDNMMHVVNVGRAVGRKWGLDKVTRWDGNQNTDGLKIFGTTVQAVIGGVYSEFGSPAAQRAFHLYLLPELASQLRDGLLTDKAEAYRRELEKELGGSILVRQQ